MITHDTNVSNMIGQLYENYVIPKFAQCPTDILQVSI